MNKVDIKTDGTSGGTVITVNGAEIAVRSYMLQQHADDSEPPVLVLSMPVNALSFDGKAVVLQVCPTCHGSGKSPIEGQICSTCGGPGTVLVDPSAAGNNN